MPNLDNLTKLHATRKHLTVEQPALEQYEINRDKALARWLQKATAHMDTPTIRKQAKEKFYLTYPEFIYKEGDKITQ